MQSSSFFSRAPARSRSSSAKWAPRLRLKVSRAVEYRFHSASSVLRSTPWMDFHSSRMARIRSPAAFHWVELVASSSASAASSSLREILAERASSRWARAAAACASADSTSAANRADRESTSPSTAAAGSVSARCSAAVLILRASPAPDPSRNSSSWTSVSRLCLIGHETSSYNCCRAARRPKLTTPFIQTGVIAARANICQMITRGGRDVPGGYRVGPDAEGQLAL
ncbi:Uncharacterised protein [Mycobacteroides abscessus subsp. abscessus]|nr:Uncharacterised protein [Mycobacteroides abscessus subsp. abscessus]